MYGLTNQFHWLLDTLVEDYRVEYVNLALKQINDQQLLHISFRGYSIPDDPILKLYEQLIARLELFLFETGDRILSEDELRELIRSALTHVNPV